MPAFPLRPRRLLSLLAAAAAVAAATGCSSVSSVVTPYKVTVVQGNFVSREQAEMLRPGLSRQQVRELLGTPLVASVFHADRWDYVFTLRRSGGQPQVFRLTVHFNGDLLERTEGDTLPTEVEFVAGLDSQRRSRPVPQLEATPEQLQRYTPARATAEAIPATVAPAPSPASYPPLESPAR